MRRLKCSSCAGEFPAATMFSVNDMTVCEPCGDRLVVDAEARRLKPRVLRIVDATICSRCKKDNGETDFRLIGGAPFCPSCGAALYAYPFPAWLKASFAGLFLLLAIALWHDGPYFAAGRQLIAARRDMDKSDYTSAVTHFAEILPLKPTEQDVILQAAKAYLMTGDVAGAGQFLDLREKYEDNAEFKEVNAFWDRANGALVKADSAGKLAQANRDEEASRLMTAAAREYPEATPLVVAALIYEGGAAFERKDYDLFLSTSREALAHMPDEPRIVASVASALACKYAVTGDPAFRVEAEGLLARAATLSAQRSPDEQAEHAEYAERIQHRLATRIIIDRDEYNRRFRNASATTVKR
jgi:hypothetical protein